MATTILLCLHEFLHELYVYISDFFYPFLHQCRLVLPPLFAIINNTSMKMGVQILVWVPAFLGGVDIYAEFKLLDDMVILVLIFWGITILFCTMATLFNFPLAVHRDSTSLPTYLIFCFLFVCLLLYNSHPNGCEVVSHFEIFKLLRSLNCKIIQWYLVYSQYCAIVTAIYF